MAVRYSLANHSRSAACRYMYTVGGTPYHVSTQKNFKQSSQKAYLVVSVPLEDSAVGNSNKTHTIKKRKKLTAPSLGTIPERFLTKLIETINVLSKSELKVESLNTYSRNFLIYQRCQF